MQIKWAICLIILFPIWAAAYTAEVPTGASNAMAESELVKVLEQGGQITFGEGDWEIHLDSADRYALGDVTIMGANTEDTANPEQCGAYEGAHCKTSIRLTGYSMQVTAGCSQLTVRDIEWVETGIKVDPWHQLTVDLKNVLFDITDWSAGLWGKVVIKTNDGIQGSIDHVTFRGYGIAGIYLSRSVSSTTYPVTQVGKLTIDHCLFDPDTQLRAAEKVSSVAHDAGNDEYAPTLDHGEKEIKNSRFIDCRISFSKGSHSSITDNVFEFTDYPNGGEAFHLEEFSHDITIHGNTMKLLGDGAWVFITAGALQIGYNLTITENTIEQTGQLTAFITGAGTDRYTLNGNEIMNPVAGRNYISFWGGNNLDLHIGTDGVDQPGLGPDYQSISSQLLAGPVVDDFYYMIWGTNHYLAMDDGAVVFIEQTEPPSAAKFKWRFTLEQMGYQSCYYTIQNMNGSGYYLEVLKGPTAPEQVGKSGTLYPFEGTNVSAKAVSTYAAFDRRPGFALFAKDGKYAVLPGHNEKRSELRKDGQMANVYVVTDETDASYEWSFIPVAVRLPIEIESYRVVGDAVTLGFSNGPHNRYFSLYSKTNLQDATWTECQTELPIDVTGAGSVTDEMTTPHVFYYLFESDAPAPKVIDFSASDYSAGPLDGQQNWVAAVGWTVGDAGQVSTLENSSAAVLNESGNYSASF